MTKKKKPSEEIKTVCKCPNCWNIHTMKMKWRGNGMPRVYCEECKGQIKTIKGMKHYSVKQTNGGQLKAA